MQPTEADLALDLPKMLARVEETIVHMERIMGTPLPSACLEVKYAAVLRRAIAAEADLKALLTREVQP